MSIEQSEIRKYLWVSPRRFGAMTGIPVSTVYRYVRVGKIRHRRRNGRLWLEASAAVEMIKARSPGVLPRKYRDEFGRPLEGAECCPRSELLWGTAGANVERSVAAAQINVVALPDSLRMRDVFAPDRGVPTRILDKATESEEDLKHGIRNTFLY